MVTTQQIIHLNPRDQYMDTYLKPQMSKAFVVFLPYLVNLLKTQENL